MGHKFTIVRVWLQSDFLTILVMPLPPVLNLVDIFSKFAYAKVLPNKSGASIREALEEGFHAMGKPKILQSDNAAEFMGGEVADFLGEQSVEARHGRPYHPQSQGVAERTGGDIKAVFMNRLRQVATEGRLLLDTNQEVLQGIGAEKYVA